MENEGEGGRGGSVSSFAFAFRHRGGWKKGRRGVFVGLWLAGLQNSAGPCALICIGRSFPARRLPLAPMRINRLPPTSPFVPFRRQGIDYCGFNIPGPFIGGYGGCCREQTDIKVIKGRRIPRRERLIAFLARGGFLPGYFRVRYWKISVLEPRPCFIATGRNNRPV